LRSSRHLDGVPVRDAQQLAVGEPDYRGRMACGGPDLRLGGEAGFYVGLERRGVADRRDPADGEAGALTHEIGVGLADGFSDGGRQLARVDAARARGHHEHRSARALAAEHQRIRDLADFAAEEGCRGLRGARGAGQLYDRRRDAGGVQRAAHAHDARVGKHLGHRGII
jgi:hypothetical protein